MLFSEIDTIVTDLTDADSTDFPTATRLIYCNNFQSEIAGVIIGTDGRWSWDDTNQTKLPIGTTNLVSGQEDYSFDEDFLVVQKVQILDASGNTARLISKDMKDYQTEIYQNNANSGGQPLHYDKDGGSVFLDPIPNYDYTDGLKVYFKRTSLDIASFGATSPGFLETAHLVLPYMIAIPYCEKYHKDRVAGYTQKVLDYKEMIRKHYSRRSQDEKFGQIKPTMENNK